MGSQRPQGGLPVGRDRLYRWWRSPLPSRSRLYPRLPSEGQGGGAVKPGTQGQGPVNACFWGQPFANVGPINELNYPVAGTNVIAPDTNTVYYNTAFELPAGATITLHGQFPQRTFLLADDLRDQSGGGRLPGHVDL